jgi:Fur family transcriptional regulator, ferric uptake regulator
MGSRPNIKNRGVFQYCESVLSNNRLKKTKPRIAILEALSGNHCPLNVEEIYRKCPVKTLDLATIYRTLRAFEDIGLVQRIDFGDGSARFELRTDDHHHHHVICRSCKKVEKLPDCGISSLEKTVTRLGYQSVTHSLEFFGLCRKCK